ncbi:hypothetical protein [Gracilimonas sp.]|uniref:hypothetical protein n=1 Tax=Gracilimonas sp. TaxID=1974203 RepID=UPI0032F03D04
MKIVRNRLLILFGALILVSCIRVQAVNFDQNQRDSKPDSYVMKILQVEDIENEYEVIGEVTANGPSNRSEKIMEKLRDRAKEMGGDALIKFESGNAGTGSMTNGIATFDETSKTVYKAQVIVWKGS